MAFAAFRKNASLFVKAITATNDDIIQYNANHQYDVDAMPLNSDTRSISCTRFQQRSSPMADYEPLNVDPEAGLVFKGLFDCKWICMSSLGVQVNVGDFVYLRLPRGSARSYIFGFASKQVDFPWRFDCIYSRTVQQRWFWKENGFAKMNPGIAYIQSHSCTNVQRYLNVFWLNIVYLGGT